jgi:hypothetical protein
VTKRLRGWAAPALLFLIALLVRAWAATQVTLPPTQVSAYYLDVARNLAAGHGLVANAVWSYASLQSGASAPPLPQPAFSLWMPLASLIAAVPMALTGQTTLAAGQAAFVLLGAATAPLVWLVARDAARLNGVGTRQAATVAVGSGLLAAAFGPFLLPVVGPDSAVPFTVLALAACLVMPRLLAAADHEDGRGTFRLGVGLGVLLGLAYLARQEAAALGLAYLFMLMPAARYLAVGARRRWIGRTLVAPVAAGAVVVGPWLVRGLVTFGGLGGQAIDNLFFVRNEDVFAYAIQPSLNRFLAQGPVEIVRHIAAGLWSQVSVDLLLTAAPIGAIGLVAWIALRRSPALRQPSALGGLLMAGLIIFLVDGLLFPVATLWGTFRHAAGPLLAALIVLSALGLDGLVALVRAWRGWERQNAWLGTLFLLLLTVPVAALEVTVTSGITSEIQARLAAASPVLTSNAADSRTPIISDWSIWLTWQLGRPALALPDEPAADVLALAHRFKATEVVVLSPGKNAAGSSTEAPSLPSLEGQPCFQRVALPAAAGPESRLYLVESDGACAP